MGVSYIHRRHEGGFAGIRFRVEKDSPKDVVVGIFSEAGEYKSGVTVPQVAAWNHEGTDGIPSRPFIASTLNKYAKEYIDAIGTIIKLILNGSVGADRARRNLGERGKRDVVQTIMDRVPPPNSDVTIERKRAKGINPPDHPLRETDKMMKSINWRIEGSPK